jgi:GR25 family glycosyltransferase involved in LPS biosynthesis
VYVINRERDADRLGRFQKSCAKWGVEFERVKGVDLRLDPDLLGEYRDRIAELCYNKLEFVRGIYGCFLGHREAWKVVAAGASDWGLVCEDDASFLGPIPKSIKQFTLPENAEIVFCNQRMGDGLLVPGVWREAWAGSFEYVETDTALNKLLEFTPHIIAPGGDAYLLSRDGARKLLKIFEETRMAFDVDWFMLFHSIGDKAMELFLQTDRTGRFDGYVPHGERLNGYVLVPSLVEQANGESKVRRMEFCLREELFGPTPAK